jgi:selenophosphate synthetase-related protein
MVQETKPVEMTIRLSGEMAHNLRAIAAFNDLEVQTLLVNYAEAGIGHDLLKLKRKQFYEHVKEVLEEHKVPAEAIAKLEEKFEW